MAGQPPFRTPHSRSKSVATQRHTQHHRTNSLQPSFDNQDFEDIFLAAPPSALTATSTAYDPRAPSLQDSPFRFSRTQQSPLTEFIDSCKLPPLISRARNTRYSPEDDEPEPEPSPTKTLASFITTASAQSTASQWTAKVRESNLLGNLFSGSSGPVHIGIVPSGEKDDLISIAEEDDMESPTARPTTLKKSPTSKSALGRFSWFAPKQEEPTCRPPPVEEQPDELLTLDVEAALFPHGPADPLDPSSFHDLLTNAELLIQRLQTGYKQKCATLRELKGENSVLEEQADEAETRARHLKIQLGDMAAKAIEQETAMKALSEQLTAERLRREEEDEARRKSVQLVRKPGSTNPSTERPRSVKRLSDGSIPENADSAYESEAESVFSSRAGAISPTTTVSTGSFSDIPTEYARQVQILSGHKPSIVKRSSTYQKVLRGMSSLEAPEEEGRGCARCCGTGGQAAAWGQVSNLRMENRELKARVGELEQAVDGCLDLVAGLRI